MELYRHLVLCSGPAEGCDSPVSFVSFLFRCCHGGTATYSTYSFCGSVVQGKCTQTNICGDKANEYSERDGNMSASNRSAVTGFARMLLMIRLQQRRQTGKGSYLWRTQLQFEISFLLLSLQSLNFQLQSTSFIPFFFFTGAHSSSWGGTYLFRRDLCEASLRHQHKSRSSSHHTLQVIIKQIISQLDGGDW